MTGCECDCNTWIGYQSNLNLIFLPPQQCAITNIRVKMAPVAMLERRLSTVYVQLHNRVHQPSLEKNLVVQDCL